ncbi:MAG: hypothetical protein HY764_02970, partial [Candidatus Portnoybacteria bacterium]|nr:hypothetical protein [Candidatus Portnoybacteria bacterium]
MKHNFFRKTALAAFIIILSASFIFPNIFTRQAGAWIMIYSYIHNFTISPTDISYEQERDGYVCIKAYPYYPEYIDPEYPEDEPYSFIDFDHPINIHSGQFELAGQKNVSWQGRDQSGDILAPGLYKFGAMIYSGPNCGGWTISQCEAYREFEVTAPPPPQSWSFAIISDLHVGQ